jgi:DNA-binding XRE family transcriptional regulator
VVNWERNRFLPELRYLSSIIAFLGYDPRPKIAAKSLPEWLVFYREAYGFTQKKLARILHVDPCTISSWERGSSKPPFEYRVRINALVDEVKGDELPAERDLD